MFTLYNVISADGFIARKNGEEDFIPDEVWSDFLNLCTKYEVVVMGRKTYDAIQGYPKKLVDEFENLRTKKVVVTRNESFVVKPNYVLVHSLNDDLATSKDVLLTSGPTLNTSALEAGLIDKIIFNVLPEKIEEGVRVFEKEPELVLLSEKDMDNGRRWCEYSIKN